MISHILVPIDRTALSTRAVPVAGALARLTGATVDLLSVEPVGPPSQEVPARLDDVTAMVPPGVGTSTRVVATVESVAATLAGLEHPAGTVMCLATHGRGPLTSLGLGSVTADLVAHASMPVLVVGPRCTTEGPAELAGPVLAAVDGSDRDDDVLATAAGWALATGVPLTVVTAVTRPREPQVWQAANALLAEGRAHVAAVGVEASVMPVSAGDVDAALLRAVEPTTGCLVMGSHRRGRLGRLLFGSTTASVVHWARCPVLVAAPPPSLRPAGAASRTTEAPGGG